MDAAMSETVSASDLPSIVFPRVGLWLEHTSKSGSDPGAAMKPSGLRPRSGQANAKEGTQVPSLDLLPRVKSAVGPKSPRFDPTNIFAGGRMPALQEAGKRRAGCHRPYTGR